MFLGGTVRDSGTKRVNETVKKANKIVLDLTVKTMEQM